MNLITRETARGEAEDYRDGIESTSPLKYTNGKREKNAHYKVSIETVA